MPVGISTQTAKPQVRQLADRWYLRLVRPAASGGAFPGELILDAALAILGAPRTVQSPVRRAQGYARVRGGLTVTTAGTVRVMEGWNEAAQASFAVVFAAATVLDPVSGLQVIDFDLPVTRTFVMVRFTGGVDLAGTFEFGAMLVPVA